MMRAPGAPPRVRTVRRDASPFAEPRGWSDTANGAVARPPAASPARRPPSSRPYGHAVLDTGMDFSGLTALFINTTLTRSPGMSHTQLLIDASTAIMAKQGVRVDQFRAIDHPIATGVYPDMRERGWEIDAWPELFARVLAADTLVIAGPIWLGDNSRETKKIIERLYAHSGELNDKGAMLET